MVSRFQSQLNDSLNDIEQMLSRVEEIVKDGTSKHLDGTAPAREDEQWHDGVKGSVPEMPPPPRLPEIARSDRRVVKRVVRPFSGQEGSGQGNLSCSQAPPLHQMKPMLPKVFLPSTDLASLKREFSNVTMMLHKKAIAPPSLTAGKQRPRNLGAYVGGLMLGSQAWSGSPRGRFRLKSVTITRFHYLKVGL